MTILLGIDPGSRLTGYGVVEEVGKHCRYVASGVIRITETALPSRLRQIFDGITRIVNEYTPTTAGIEQVFMSKNADSALKLGQARGAAIVAMVNFEVEVSEYSARQIKQAVVGTGAADKAQVQNMVKSILQLNKLPPADAADALAVAICHSHIRTTSIRLASARSIKR